MFYFMFFRFIFIYFKVCVCVFACTCEWRYLWKKEKVTDSLSYLTSGPLQEQYVCSCYPIYPFIFFKECSSSIEEISLVPGSCPSLVLFKDQRISMNQVVKFISHHLVHWSIECGKTASLMPRALANLYCISWNSFIM